MMIHVNWPLWLDCEKSTIVRNQQVNIFASLLAGRLAHQQHRLFLSSGECFYVNVQSRKEWLSLNQKTNSQAKTGTRPDMLMLCIWWHGEGVASSTINCFHFDTNNFLRWSRPLSSSTVLNVFLIDCFWWRKMVPLHEHQEQ